MSPSRKAYVVALNRRNYPGSTPYDEKDVDVIVNGTKEQKDAWHRDQSHELGMFIHKLIDKGNLPPISADRKTGGVAVVGWSSGAGNAIGMIAHPVTLPPAIRTGLALHVRFLIVQGVSHFCVVQSPFRMSFLDSHRGSMPLPGFYTPMIDEKIPLENRAEKFCHKLGFRLLPTRGH